MALASKASELAPHRNPASAVSSVIAQSGYGHIHSTASQLSFFARRTVIEFPKAKPTADALGEAEVDDGHRYYLKSDVNGVPVRASEWITTHLAEKVGIAAPQPMIIEMRDGSFVFGSRRITGVADDMETRNFLLTPSAVNTNAPATGLSAILSAIYAFDMFIFNVDRHFGNYLSVQDLGIRRFFAFDYSRAFFWRWPWNGIPDITQHTRTHGKLLWSLHSFDSSAADKVLSDLQRVDATAIGADIARMPAEWLSSDLRNEFMLWWNSDDRLSRLDLIRREFRDGTGL